MTKMIPHPHKFLFGHLYLINFFFFNSVSIFHPKIFVNFDFFSTRYLPSSNLDYVDFVFLFIFWKSISVRYVSVKVDFGDERELKREE